MKTSVATPLAAAGRLLLVPLFVTSGLAKLAAPAATIGDIASTHAPLPVLGYAIALTVELGLSLALLLGFQTRLVATAMALFTLATALMFHTGGDQDQALHFWKNAAIAGGLLQVAAFGAGGWSLDALRSARRPPAAP